MPWAIELSTQGTSGAVRAGGRSDLIAMVQAGGYCRRPALPLINLAYLLAGERLLWRTFVFGRSSPLADADVIRGSWASDRTARTAPASGQ